MPEPADTVSASMRIVGGPGFDPVGVQPVEMPERAPDPLRPPRLTFAGSCLWCGERGCRSSDCARLHEQSQWDICRGCDGTGELCKGGQHRGCDCAYGLALVAPKIQRRREVVPGFTVTDEGHWSSGWHDYHVSWDKKPSAYTVVAEEEPTVDRNLRPVRADRRRSR
ncbi:hypothetical protein [Nocardia sp. CS682]|uniref:hypothetical protein n=1 Tax=Nocardia sp. CS682 TaxID=1047172 RepID=UPI0010751E4D|nr:hypothetical protein [Nocardia sp. CS682]QBS42853.1 hypothetical protein DMB37_24900 [Nocardia sp. CS682]